MRDFNTVCSELAKRLRLSVQRSDGTIWWYEGTLELLTELLSFAASDVRPVVLCRDCKYYRQDAEFADAKGFVREWYCPIHEAEFAEDAFCSYGRLDAERRN